MKFRKVRLCDLCSIVTDYVANGSFKTLADKVKYLNEGYARVIRLVDYNNKYSKKDSIWVSKESYEFLKKSKLYGGEIVLTNVGANLGTVFIAPQLEYPTTLGPNAIMIKTNENDKYLYYWLKSKNGQNTIKSIVTGSAMPKFNKTDLKNIEIAIPCIEDQDKIVEILSNIDKKIELNNQTNDNLYNMCNAIFHNYLNKYSEQIEYTKIVDIADRVITGKTPSTKNEEFWNGEIPFITIPDMHNQVFTIDTERTISDVGAKSIIPENSISVSCIATVGLVSISTKRSQTNQQINSIILKNDYDLYYLFEFLSEQERIMKNIAGGSTTYNINKTTFENIEIPYLPQSIIQEFHDTVCKVFDKIKLNQLENKNLEQLRDTLLPKLMNGEMDLDNIKI